MSDKKLAGVILIWVDDIPNNWGRGKWVIFTCYLQNHVVLCFLGALRSN